MIDHVLYVGRAMQSFLAAQLDLATATTAEFLFSMATSHLSIQGGRCLPLNVYLFFRLSLWERAVCSIAFVCNQSLRAIIFFFHSDCSDFQQHPSADKIEKDKKIPPCSRKIRTLEVAWFFSDWRMCQKQGVSTRVAENFIILFEKKYIFKVEWLNQKDLDGVERQKDFRLPSSGVALCRHSRTSRCTTLQTIQCRGNSAWR